MVQVRKSVVNSQLKALTTALVNMLGLSNSIGK
jgi:hypothetical protein